MKNIYISRRAWELGRLMNDRGASYEAVRVTILCEEVEHLTLKQT